MDQVAIPRFVNLLANDVWSDADITNRARAIVSGQVSEQRQQELQTIMLGHIAQMRSATAEEMAEIVLVKTLTEAAADAGRQARADMALLSEVLAYEAAQTRLAAPVFDGLATVMVSVGMGEALQEEPNPAIAKDVAEREAAQVLIEGASQEVLDLFALRHPAPVEPAQEFNPLGGV